MGRGRERELPIPGATHLKNPDAYEVREVIPEDRPGLRALAREVWPDRPENIFADRWWLRGSERSALVGIHRDTNELVGVLADRRCRVEIEGRTVSASGICDWYLSPRHSGHGLGKRLMKKLIDAYDLVIGISPTEVSHANLKRLGFGPVFPAPAYLAPVPSAWIAARVARTRSTAKLEVTGLDLHDPSDVPAAIDLIWAARGDRSSVSLVRDAAEIRWRVGVTRARDYRLFLAYAAGKPAGYLLARVGPRGTSNRLAWSPLGLVVDFLTVDPEESSVFVSLLEQCLAWFARKGAPLALALTTLPSAAQTFHRLGFVSPATPLVGAKLGKLGTRFTYRYPTGHTEARAFHFTFADADLDLALGAIREAREIEPLSRERVSL